MEPYRKREQNNGVVLDGTFLLLIGPSKSKKVLYLLAEGGSTSTRDRLKKWYGLP